MRGLGDPVLRRFALVQFLLEVQFWFPVWLIFLRDRGFGLGIIVAADAVFRLTVVAAELPLGYVADRIGRRRAHLAIAGLTVLAQSAIAFVAGTVALFAAWVLWGLLWAMTSGAGPAYLFELARQRGRAGDQLRVFGQVRAVTNGAVLASHLTAGALYAWHPRAPFLVSAAFGAVAFVLVLGLPDIARDRVARARAAPMIAGLRASLADRPLRATVALGAAVLVFGWSVRILFQPLILELELSPSFAGLSYFGYSLMSIVAGLAVARSSTWGGPRTTRVGLAVLWAGVLGAGLFPELGPWVFVPAIGFGYHLVWTVLEVVVNERTPDARRATVLSFVSLAGGLLVAGARPLLGLMADAWSATVAFQVWAAVGLAAVPFALVTTRAVTYRVRAGAGRPGPATGTGRPRSGRP